VKFEFDEDQRLLQQAVRETLAKTAALPEAELWATYQGLGWLEAPPVELAIVLEELGYVADPTPFLATATWFAPLAGRLPAGSGSAVFDGAGRFVLDGDRADEIALLTGDGVAVVSGADVTAEAVQRAHWHALEERGTDGLNHPARTAPDNHIGHGNALSVGGYPILTDLANLKEHIKSQ
jgi:hypothetical protein